MTEILFYVFDWHEGGFVAIHLSKSIVLVASTMEKLEEEVRREVSVLYRDERRVSIRLRRFMTYKTKDYLVVLQKPNNYGTRTA